jgi:hypothetical protein
VTMSTVNTDPVGDRNPRRTAIHELKSSLGAVQTLLRALTLSNNECSKNTVRVMHPSMHATEKTKTRSGMFCPSMGQRDSCLQRMKPAPLHHFRGIRTSATMMTIARVGDWWLIMFGGPLKPIENVMARDGSDHLQMCPIHHMATGAKPMPLVEQLPAPALSHDELLLIRSPQQPLVKANDPAVIKRTDHDDEGRLMKSQKMKILSINRTM